MFKIWVSWGIDAHSWLTPAKIPNVKDIQKKIVLEKLRILNTKLSESGRAELSATGLLPESISLILKECAANGYMIWKCRPPSDGDYYITVNPDNYVSKYCDNVTANYLDKELTLAASGEIAQ